MKEQFYSLQMNVCTKILNHLSVLNVIISKLEAIGVKIDYEDKALRFIWSLPSSHECIKPIFFRKETGNLAEITNKVINEKRRSGESNISFENSLFVAEEWKVS